MALSEEDKARHPYFQKKRAEEEKKRWGEFTRKPEYVKVEKDYQRAL